MLARLRRWWALPPSERRDVLVLCLLLPALAASLRVSGYRATRARVDRASSPSRRTGPPSASHAQRLAELAAIAGRQGPLKSTCLPQALAVLLLLRRRGADPDIKFGVDRLGATPDMHAWVELDGQALGQVAPRHKPFAR
jgi:hypothetical protein